MTNQSAIFDLAAWAGNPPMAAGELEPAARRFFTHYTARHGQIKVLGMTEPLPLDAVYTAVQLASPDYLQDFATPEDLIQAFRAKGARGFWRGNEVKQDGLTVANEVQFLNVLGQPGAGKSTFLRRIGLEALHGLRPDGYQHRCLPVFIELKTLDLQEASLETLIENEFTTCGLPASFAGEALAQGRLLILLDGLDEVAAELVQPAIRQIRDFVDRYSENRFVTSCRTAFYHQWFPRFTDVILADFDDQQIKCFVHNCCSSPKDRQHELGAQFWNLLQRPEHAATLELARTPLLLTFLCLVFKRTRSLPGNRSYLYKRALDILLDEWATEKLVPRPEIYEGLYPDIEVQLLGHIAGPSFAENRLFFSEPELNRLVTQFLANELNTPKRLNAAPILKAIEVQQGLIVQRAHDAFSFSHLTLHEYLAARYYLDHGKTVELVSQYLFQERWREVFRLLAGMAPANILLQGMVAKSQQRLYQHPNLLRLVTWAEDLIAETADAGKATAAKAAALFLALDHARDLTPHQPRGQEQDLLRAHLCDTARDLTLALARGCGLTRDFDRALTLAQAHHDPALDQDLEANLQRLEIFRTERILAAKQNFLNLRSLTPPSGSPRAEQFKFLHRLSAAFLAGLGLDEKLFKALEEELPAVQEYLYASLLVVECKEAALGLSRRGWAEVLQRLLTAPKPKAGN